MRLLPAVALLLLLPGASLAQSAYTVPPREIVEVIDAAPTPLVLVNPTGTAMLLVEYRAHPPLALLARPIHRLAGIRIDPARRSRQHLTQYTGLEVVALPTGATMRVTLPAGATIGMPVWSHDGSRFAFTRDTDTAVELWWGDARTGTVRQVAGLQVNDVLGPPVQWLGDARTLVVALAPPGKPTMST